MKATRLEAFSDGVIAIIITVMVLGMRAPNGTEWSALVPVIPVFLTYLMSFVYLAIYWNNHHHMLHVTERVNGRILWANLHLLFWLSLVPFVTAWMGENHFGARPTALYGGVLLMAAVAYTVLQATIVSTQGPESRLRKAVGRDRKGKASLLLYAAAIGLSFWNHWVSVGIYIFVALLWLVPDRRIERSIA